MLLPDLRGGGGKGTDAGEEDVHVQECDLGPGVESGLEAEDCFAAKELVAGGLVRVEGGALTFVPPSFADA